MLGVIKLETLDKMLLGWLSDSGSSGVKVRDEHKKHKRAYTEPAIGKGHSSIEEDSRVSNVLTTG